MNVQLHLPDEQLAALAERVADLLEQRAGAAATGSEWLRGAQAAAEYLGSPRSRIYDLVAQGRLEPRRDGRVLVFRRDDLDRFVEAS